MDGSRKIPCILLYFCASIILKQEPHRYFPYWVQDFAFSGSGFVLGMGKRDWRPFVYGGVSSCIAEFSTFPIDTTKTRLQIQGGKQDGQVVATRYRGMFHAIYRISNEEGIRALYNGIGPAVLRQATYGTIKFGIYYSLKQIFFPTPEDETLAGNILCGVTAGVVSSAIANPTDVLKVRLQSGRTKLKNATIFDAFMAIYKEEGIAGLWRGVGPTAQRAGVIVGVELPIYDAFKRYFISNNLLEDGAANHLMSSFIASLGGALASTPIDVIKTRLMNQQALIESSGKLSIPGKNVSSVSLKNVYCGTLDCLVKTVSQEGPSALYKGFVPTWFRLGPWNIIFFVTFEQLKKL